MFKTRSYTLVNAVLNHPDVRPTIEAGIQYLDSRAIISDPENVVYAGEEGVALFTVIQPGLYRGHIGLLPQYRGATGLKAARDVLDDLFKHRVVTAVVAAVPLRLRQARLFCKMLGFETKTLDPEQEWMVYEGGKNGRAN